MTLPFTLYSNRNINNLFTYKTSAAYNALSKTLRHNVRSPFGKRRDDCSTASFGEVKVSALVQIQKDTGTTESTHIYKSKSQCISHDCSINIHINILTK